jgi:hypothetical protein
MAREIKKTTSYARHWGCIATLLVASVRDGQPDTLKLARSSALSL